jgi:hypothetical protein
MEKEPAQAALKPAEFEPAPARRPPENGLHKLGNQAARQFLEVTAQQGEEERHAERQADRALESAPVRAVAEPVAPPPVARQALAGGGDDVPPVVPNPLAALGPASR